MPKYREQPQQNQENAGEVIRQLEQLFDVAIGKETSLDELRETLYADEPQGVFRVLVTKDFRIFLSNRTHDAIAKTNGVDWGDVLLSPFIPAGELLAGNWGFGYWYWDNTDAEKLAEFFREKTRLQEKYSQQVLEPALEAALHSRITEFVRGNLVKK